MKTLIHIDNNFFKLSAKQAKSLSIENRLPNEGMAIKADLARLKGHTLDFGHSIVPANNIKEAWIQKTPLRYWQGEEFTQGWAWALHVIF